MSRRRGPYHRRAVNLPGIATVLWLFCGRRIGRVHGEGVQPAGHSAVDEIARFLCFLRSVSRKSLQGYIYIAFAIVQGGRFSRSELSCPISDVTGLLPVRTHFASWALQHGLLLS